MAAVNRLKKPIKDINIYTADIPYIHSHLNMRILYVVASGIYASINMYNSTVIHTRSYKQFKAV